MKNPKQKRIQKLKELIRYHDHLYYNLDRSEITDYEYDKLFKELIEIETKHPELKTKDSPSQKIPGKALEKFKKSPHSLAMLSLQNSYSKEDISDFYNRILKLLNVDSIECFLEPKLDGVAVELIYEKGLLVKALTRGDGKTGEDITENIKSLRGLPLSLGNIQKPPPLLEVRAEVMISKKDFQRINQEQEETGLNTFANPRNLSAGSLRQLDPKITRSRPLQCFIHSPGLIKGLSLKSQGEFMKKIKDFSLPCFEQSASSKLKAPLKLCRLTQSLKEIWEYYDQILGLRHELPFEMDGIVIKLNHFEQQKKLGTIARSPRWAIAGKFPAEEGETKINNIRWQVGRTGVVTPVAILEPLFLGGVWIRQASLHNFQDLKKKDIRIGDKVLIHRAGDVIPEVLKPLKEKRKKGLKTLHQPTNCPICKRSLKQKGDYLMCSNKQCSAVKINRLIHFCSKGAMNIEFLGKESIKKFYEWKWLNSYSDIYDLENKDLKSQPGFGEKSYDLLVKSLEKSKKTELDRLIFALGIALIGQQTAQKISEKIYQIHGKKKLSLQQALLIIQKLSREELESITDVGPLAAQSFKSTFEDKDLIFDLKKLEQKGIHFITKEKQGESLKGLKFVITGKLPEPRSQIKKNIEAQGGQVLSQISQSTNFLLQGEKPGSKKKKAQEGAIQILDWNDFLKLIGR